MENSSFAFDDLPGQWSWWWRFSRRRRCRVDWQLGRQRNRANQQEATRGLQGGLFRFGWVTTATTDGERYISPCVVEIKSQVYGPKDLHSLVRPLRWPCNPQFICPLVIFCIPTWYGATVPPWNTSWEGHWGLPDTVVPFLCLPNLSRPTKINSCASWKRINSKFKICWPTPRILRWNQRLLESGYW